MLSFCAAATSRIRVGTALAVLPMRDPFWLAKQSATIDQLSGGRLVLALGITHSIMMAGVVSANVVLVALAVDRAVGVDVEVSKEPGDATAIAPAWAS